MVPDNNDNSLLDDLDEMVAANLVNETPGAAESAGIVRAPVTAPILAATDPVAPPIEAPPIGNNPAKKVEEGKASQEANVKDGDPATEVAEPVIPSSDPDYRVASDGSDVNKK